LHRRGEFWASTANFEREGFMKRILFALVTLFCGPALAQQNAPPISFTSVPDFLSLPPGMN
jgi:hypothetical protein